MAQKSSEIIFVWIATGARNHGGDEANVVRRGYREENGKRGEKKTVLSENSFAGRTFGANMKLNEKDPGRRAMAVTAVSGWMDGGGARDV